MGVGQGVKEGDEAEATPRHSLQGSLRASPNIRAICSRTSPPRTRLRAPEPAITAVWGGAGDDDSDKDKWIPGMDS